MSPDPILSEPEFWSWAYWTVERSDVVRNLFLAATALTGLIFLVWRSISADRTARAAVRQAQTATGHLELATKQLDIAVKSSEAVLGQSQAALRQADNAAQKTVLETYSKAIELLGTEDSPALRTGCIHILNALAKQNSEYWQGVVSILLAHIRQTAQLNSKLSFKAKYVPHSEQTISELSGDLPYWLFGLEEQIVMITPETVDQSDSLLKGSDEIIANLKQSLLEVIASTPYWQRELDKRRSTLPDVQACLSAISAINSKYNSQKSSHIAIERCDLSGYSLSGLDLRNVSFARVNLSLAQLVSSNFSNCMFHDVDFRGSMLDNSVFDGSEFILCDLSGSKVDGASFRGCNFTVSNLSRLDGLTSDQFDHAIFGHNCKKPSRLSLKP